MRVLFLLLCVIVSYGSEGYASRDFSKVNSESEGPQLVTVEHLSQAVRMLKANHPLDSQAGINAAEMIISVANRPHDLIDKDLLTEGLSLLKISGYYPTRVYKALLAFNKNFEEEPIVIHSDKTYSRFLQSMADVAHHGIDWSGTSAKNVKYPQNVEDFKWFLAVLSYPQNRIGWGIRSYSGRYSNAIFNELEKVISNLPELTEHKKALLAVKAHFPVDGADYFDPEEEVSLEWSDVDKTCASILEK